MIPKSLGSRIKGAIQGFKNPQPQQETPEYGKIKKLSEDKAREMLDDLTLKINAGIAACAPAKKDMMQADKYWLGDHWEDNAPPWMPKPVENWVFATVEQHSANLSTANIVPIIYGQDPGDDEIANMFDLVIQYLAAPNKLNLRRITRRSIHAALKFGTALVKVYFDPTINGGRQFPETRNVYNPLTQQEFPISHTLYKGEVEWELVDPSNVIPDPDGYTLQGPGACSWVAIRTPRKKEWVANNLMFQKYMGQSKLKEAVERLESPGDRTSTEFYLGRTINSSHLGSNMVMLDEIWIRTMDEYGNWHINLVYKTGDILLYYAEDVFKDGQFPFAVLYDYEVDKSFFGMGEPKQVIPNQHTINQVTRLTALNAMHMTNTQKVVTTDSGVNPDEVAEIGSMPGAVFKSRTPDGVTPLKVSEIPASMFKVSESAREGIRTIMAMDEANMGQFGGSVTAARGIELVQNKANVRDQDKGYNIEDFVSRLVYLTISRLQQYYTEERYFPILGENGRPDGYFPFTGTEYQDICLTVHIEAGSGTPLNRTAIAQRAWEMFQKQAELKFDPPLITVEELLETYEGFPLKERMKKRIKDYFEQQKQLMAQQQAMMQQQGTVPSIISGSTQPVQTNPFIPQG